MYSFVEPTNTVTFPKFKGERVYMREFHKGICSKLDLSGLDPVDMYANLAWKGDVAFIHESLPVQQDVFRTVVRLNVRH